MSSINSNEGKIFLDVPGGTGKTFLINLLLAKVRFDKKEPPIPLKICTDDVSNICIISKQSYPVKLMKDCSLQILGWGFYVS